jgi:hypothetical protein
MPVAGTRPAMGPSRPVPAEETSSTVVILPHGADWWDSTELVLSHQLTSERIRIGSPGGSPAYQ